MRNNVLWPRATAKYELKISDTGPRSAIRCWLKMNNRRPSWTTQCRSKLNSSDAHKSHVCQPQKLAVDSEQDLLLQDPELLRVVRYLPLPAVVNYDLLKAALLLAAVDPGIGGVLIAGGRGTCKTVMTRGLVGIMPPIEVVPWSYWNADPTDGQLVHSAGGSPQATAIRPTPFITLPLGVTEDRLLGSIDLEQSVAAGQAVFQPGLLAAAHRGVLYVDDINLLDPGISSILTATLACGFNAVEREGLSVRHPCRPLLVATFNPEEGELSPGLLDRFAFLLATGPLPDVDSRVRATEVVMQHQDSPLSVWREVEDEMGDIQARVAAARQLLPTVHITPDQVSYLVKEAQRGGVSGHRPELYAARTALAAAALAGRQTVAAGDLRLAVNLCILPRSVQVQAPPAAPPPQPQTPPAPAEKQEEEDNKKEETQQEMKEPQPAMVPQEFLITPEGVHMDLQLAGLMHLQKLRMKGATGRTRKSVIFSQDTGRYVKPMLPKGPLRRIAVDATLRAAAPYQRSRRKRLEAADEREEKKPERQNMSEYFGDAGVQSHGGSELMTSAEDKAALSALHSRLAQQLQRQRHKPEGSKRRVYIEAEDVRVKKLARKAGSLVVFVVDASGSMALNRMALAKGVAIQLLSESYRSRDQVSLITFCNQAAEVLLPPTRAVALAKKRLEILPCGGGTPLSHALATAVRVGLLAKKRSLVGRMMIVLVTDGRANISLADSLAATGEDNALLEIGKAGRGAEGTIGYRDAIEEEVLAVAKQVARAGFEMVVIDTESPFYSRQFAKKIAESARAQYVQLPCSSPTRKGATSQQLLDNIQSMKK